MGVSSGTGFPRLFIDLRASHDYSVTAGPEGFLLVLVTAASLALVASIAAWIRG